MKLYGPRGASKTPTKKAAKKAGLKVKKVKLKRLKKKDFLGFPGQHRGPNGRGFQLDPDVLDVMEEAMIAVKQLATMAAANGAVMVVGPPGCGKVELSKMAALQMTGKKPRHVNMAIIDDTRYPFTPHGVVTTSSDLDKALDVSEGTAVILDELDKVPESRQLTMVAPILEFLSRGRPTFVCVQKPENVLPIIRTRLRQVEMEELYPEKERLEAWARQ